MNVYVWNCLFLQHFPYIKNEELRTNNKPKNKRRRIYD